MGKGVGAVRCSADMRIPTKQEKDDLVENGQETRPRPSQKMLSKGPVKIHAGTQPHSWGGVGGCKSRAHQNRTSQVLF